MEYDKWIPGEGINLSGENPYESFTNVAGLKEYTGTYDFLDNTKLELEIDERERSIIAVYQGRRYPVFYLGKDRFKLLEGQEIVFIRDEKQKLTGFMATGRKEGFIKKID